ncbi:MAG: DUF3343 domain-containing protein [Ruminococcus sp.]|nr:DUF3343 domain-containing protein [Ruminococcus sp.]
MTEYTAEMPSYTYAMKAEKLLKARGIRCEIKRREEGCGYNICLYNKTSFEILRKNGIPFKLKETEES